MCSLIFIVRSFILLFRNNRLTNDINRDNQERNQQADQPRRPAQRLNAQHRAAEGHEQELQHQQRADDQQEVLVPPQMLKRVRVLRAGIEAVEADGHHERRKHGGVQHDTYFFS